MELDLGDLPADLDLLKTLVRDLVGKLEEQDGLIAKLKHELALFQRHSFGRKSERMDPDQLLFSFLAEALKEATETPEEEEAEAPSGEKKGKHGRGKLPEELPRDTKEHKVAAAGRKCKGCGRDLERIGEEVTEKLEYQPASFFVVRHVREKLACKACEENVVTAPLPPQPIEKGMAGAGLLAHVLVSKYEDHLPLARLERIFEREGLEISRSTLCDWVAGSSRCLEPIYAAMREDVLLSKKLNVDETKMPVLDQTVSSGLRSTGFWTYVGDEEHPHTVYEHAPEKSSAAPRSYLSSFEGYLQADAHPGYDDLYKDGRIVEAGCMAHARRKFFDAERTDRGRAMTALAYIRLLYRIEREVKGVSAEERLEVRHARSRPMCERFKDWLEQEILSVLPESPMGQAMKYATTHWAALTRFLESGILEIDNNAAERALRPVVVGRKNYLFAGSDRGAHRAAVIYSVIASAKRHGVERFAYLRDVLERLPTHPREAIRELFPANWKPP
jgi:transposase